MNREHLKKLVLEELEKTQDEEEGCLEEMGCPDSQDTIDHSHEQEGKMHRSSLFKMAKYSVDLLDIIQDEDDLPEWVESKITKAADYLAAVKKHIGGEIVRSSGNLMEEKDRMAAIRDAAEVDAYKLAGTATKAMNSAKDQIGEPLINKFFQNDDDKFGFLDKIHGDIQTDLLEEMGLSESKKNKE